MKKLWTIGLTLGALGMAACAENTAPSSDGGAANPLSGAGNPGSPASPQTSAAGLSVLDQSGGSAPDSGGVGAPRDFKSAGDTGAASPGLSAAVAVRVPGFWGRLRGEPV